LRFSFLAVALVAILVQASCAKVGEPLPPLPANTVEIDDLRILISGEDVYLTFSHPERDLTEIEVYRLCETEEAESIRETSPLLKIAGSEIRVFGFLDRVGIRIPEGEVSPECVYAVRTRNLRDKRSGFSNTIRWFPSGPLPPPNGLRAETAMTRIRIEWDDNQAGGTPVAADNSREYLFDFREITKNSFYSIDDFSFGEPLSFEVRTITRAGGNVFLSLPARLENFVPRDVFPPQAPTGLLAVRMEGRVQLTWDQNRESDLAGYYVYRRRSGEGPVRISSMLAINRFVDEDPPNDSELIYTVTAVDTWDNESEHSN